jgi:uncharacterized membrane protein YeaQ/YmgE (transglycosylase-associated protein family)
VGYSVGGCLTSIFVGVVGAYLGVWVARSLNLPLLLPLAIGEVTFPTVWSVIGAALFAAALGIHQTSASWTPTSLLIDSIELAAIALFRCFTDLVISVEVLMFV